MKAYFHNGLHVFMDGLHLLFDPTNVYEKDQITLYKKEPRVDIILVSHGHADHCNSIENDHDTIPTIMHEATRKIVSHYQKIKNVTTINIGGRIEMKGVGIEAFEGGHCIGSLQFRITSVEGRFVYTGDIDTKGSLTNDPAPMIEGDFLAIECTLGDPSMEVEHREVVYTAIHAFLEDALNRSKVSIFYGYPLGISQELVYLINDMGYRNLSVLVDGMPFKISELYEKHKKSLGKYSEWTNGLPKGKVALIANLSWLKYDKNIGRRINIRKPPEFAISGKKINDKIPHVKMSLHSSHDELMNYVENSGATVVLPFHGKHAAFAKSIEDTLDGIEIIDVHERTYSLQDNR